MLLQIVDTLVGGPIVHALGDRVLGIETKEVLNTRFCSSGLYRSRNELSNYFYPLVFPDLSSKQKDIKLTFCSQLSLHTMLL